MTSMWNWLNRLAFAPSAARKTARKTAPKARTPVCRRPRINTNSAM